MKDNILNFDFMGEEIISISDDYSSIGRLMGQNKQHILVIFSSAQYDVSQYQELLHKVLASVNLSHEQDVQFFALTSKTPFSALRLAQAKNCQKIVVFGDNLAQLGIHKLLPKYEVTNMGDVELIVSDSFQDLEADLSKKNKMALWKALQALMGLTK